MSTDWAKTFQSQRAIRGECSDPGEIWDAVHGTLPARQIEALIDHSVGCGACAQLWRMARDGQGSPELRPAAAELPSRWRAWLGWGGLTAVGAAATVAVLLARPEPRVERGRPETPAITARLPSTTLSRDDFLLRWTDAGQGARYRVLVTTVDLTVLDTAGALPTPEYRVPPERLAALPAGTPLLWRVEAQLPDGKTLSSPAMSVVLR